MIKEYYLIYEPISGGWWSEAYSSFKGIIFATHYLPEVEAEKTITKIPKSGYYTIQKIYEVR